MDQLVKIENLNKIFYGHHHVLKDISLSVDYGKNLGIIGASGSGKTTLARIVAGFDSDYLGRVDVFGDEVKEAVKKDKKSFYSKTQYVFQNPFKSINPRILVEEYLREPLVNYKLVEKKQVNQEIRKWLDLVSVSKNFIYKSPHELSGGQLQRLAIARALMVRPRLVIFDEITSGLDIMIQEDILEMIKESQSRFDFTSIYISHDFSVIERMCDQVAVLKDGQLLEKKEITKDGRSLETDYGKRLLAAVIPLKKDFDS